MNLPTNNLLKLSRDFSRRVRGAYRLRHKRRDGFTLMELMLVMAVIVTVLGLALPSINRSFASQALSKGADRVRAAMGRARVQALREGDVYCVYIENSGRWFDVAAYNAADQQIAKSRKEAGDSNQRSVSNFEDSMLPNGIKFVAGSSYIDARAAAAASENGSKGIRGSNIEQILFYPDGTSQDARVVLQNEKGGLVEIQLRGLTGLAKSVRLKENR